MEAHVHSGVRFDRDVEAVVLDPCHADGPVGATAAAARSGVLDPQAVKRVWHLLARFGRVPHQ